MGGINEAAREARVVAYTLRTKAYKMQSYLDDLSEALEIMKDGRVADYYRIESGIDMMSELSASAKHDVNKLMLLGVHVGDLSE